MAALPKIGGQPATDIVLPNGWVERTFRASNVASGADDEWVVTGLSNITSIVGCVAIGTAVPTTPPVFRRNAQGTGSIEGSTPGALAIETGDALILWEITVKGVP